MKAANVGSQTGRGKTDTNHIDRDRSSEVQEYSPARSACDLQCFGEFGQVVEQDHISALARDVGP
jgi:hypothetical protein